MRLRHYSAIALFQRRLAAPRAPCFCLMGLSSKSTQRYTQAHSAQHRARAVPPHSATSRFTQTTKPSQEPRNKKSVLAATFLRLATLFRPWRAGIGRFMAGHLRFCAAIRDLTTRNNCQSQKSCKSTWIFVLRTGGSAVAERIPRKIGSRQQQRSQYREMGGYRATHHQRLNPISFLKDSHP